MTQLVVTLKDNSYVPNIRRIVKSLQGVESVSVAIKDKSVSQKKSTVGKSRGSAVFLKGLTVQADTSSERLIDEYLSEKYGL